MRRQIRQERGNRPLPETRRSPLREATLTRVRTKWMWGKEEARERRGKIRRDRGRVAKARNASDPREIFAKAFHDAQMKPAGKSREWKGTEGEGGEDA